MAIVGNVHKRIESLALICSLCPWLLAIKLLWFRFRRKSAINATKKALVEWRWMSIHLWNRKRDSQNPSFGLGRTFSFYSLFYLVAACRRPILSKAWNFMLVSRSWPFHCWMFNQDYYFAPAYFPSALAALPSPTGHRWLSECESGACEANQRLQHYIAIASQSRKSDYIHYHVSPFVQRPSRISMRPTLRRERAKRKLRKFNSTNKKRITSEYFLI